MSNSGTTTLTVSSKEMTDIFRVIKSLKNSLLKQLEMKQKRGWFAGIIIRYIDASLLWNSLAGKRVIRAVDGVTRACQDF